MQQARGESTSPDFAKALQRELQKVKNDYSLTDDKAFLFWFATQILEIQDELVLEGISVEGANDKGIDLFHVDNEEGRVVIAQGKYSRALAYAAKESDVANLGSSLDWLSSPEALERESKPELAQAARDYIDAQKEGYGVELIYLYAGKKSANVDKKINVYNQNRENITAGRSFRHYHAGLLKDLWEEMHGEHRRISEDHIAIIGSSLSTNGNFGDATVLTVPGSEIVRLYRQYEDRLFDRNVRLFLGVRKGSVNAGLAATIRDPKERANFWAYNNGITILCDNFEPEGNKVCLKNFSIVNGCQTTVSLAENGGDAPDVSVLVRCIAVPAGIVDEVIRYTNSQNPIRTWDIASQDKTQRRLKKEFEALKKPYIYLTRRGSRPSGSLQKYREEGKLRQIRIDIVGQFMAAFRGNPVLAYKHKSLIFSRHHDDVFPPDITALSVLFTVTAGETCKEIVRNLMRKDEEHSRILKKGGTLFSLAVLSEVARARNGSNFLTAMNEEQVSSAASRSRLKKYAEYAARLYVSSVIDEVRLQPASELTTLVRQKEFFSQVLKRAIRQYEKDALNAEWLDGVLPRLGLKK